MTKETVIARGKVSKINLSKYNKGYWIGEKTLMDIFRSDMEDILDGLEGKTIEIVIREVSN